MDISTPVSASRSAAAAGAVAERGQWSLAAERFGQHRLAVFGLAVFVALIVLAAFANIVSP